MGYRIRLSKFPKESFEKYQNATFQELLKICNVDQDDETISQLPEQRELITLQAGINEEFLKTYCKPFFNSYDPKDHGHDFFIIEKDALLKIIDEYNDEIISMLDERIEHLEKGVHEIELFNLKQKRDKWSFEICGRKLRPYLLKDNVLNSDNNLDGSIVGDGTIEYQIFNLVFIHNTFDWDKDLLILSGW